MVTRGGSQIQALLQNQVTQFIVLPEYQSMLNYSNYNIFLEPFLVSFSVIYCYLSKKDKYIPYIGNKFQFY